MPFTRAGQAQVHPLPLCARRHLAAVWPHKRRAWPRTHRGLLARLAGAALAAAADGECMLYVCINHVHCVCISGVIVVEIRSQGQNMCRCVDHVQGRRSRGVTLQFGQAGVVDGYFMLLIGTHQAAWHRQTQSAGGAWQM